MSYPRGIVTKGQFLVRATYSADLAARADEAQRSKRPVTKGRFMNGGACPAGEVAGTKTRAAKLPQDLQQFEAAIGEANRLVAQGFGEVEERLAEARRKLNELRKAARLK